MTTDPIKALEAANDKLGDWMSAALDDPKVCQSMKADINAWFTAIEALKRADVVMVDRNTVLEEAAKVHEPSCSCPHPCDDYWIWPSSCHKKAAAVIRALKTAPPAPVDDGERVRAAKIEAFDEALSIAEGSYSYGEQQNEIIAGIRAALAAINGEK